MLCTEIFVLSLSSSLDSPQGLSMKHQFFSWSCPCACVWDATRFGVGLIPSKTAFCSRTDPGKGCTACRNQLYWQGREIRRVERAGLLMSPLPRRFRRRRFLCAPSCPLSALKTEHLSPRSIAWGHRRIWGLVVSFWWLLAPLSTTSRFSQFKIRGS